MDCSPPKEEPEGSFSSDFLNCLVGVKNPSLGVSHYVAFRAKAPLDKKNFLDALGYIKKFSWVVYKSPASIESLKFEVCPSPKIPEVVEISKQFENVWVWDSETFWNTIGDANPFSSACAFACALARVGESPPEDSKVYVWTGTDCIS